MGNVGFMHSLLCQAALHRHYCGKEGLDTIIYHRSQAVTAINFALSSPELDDVISDANIGAVFNLLTIEE